MNGSASVKNVASGNPESELFEEYFDRLMALAHQRMEIEWISHRRADLQLLRADLLEIHREFGALLRVVFRYRLFEALREEAIGYAAMLAHRRSPHDALALLFDSWIMAILGLIRPPECNALAAPLKKLRDDLPALLREMPSRRPDEASLALMGKAVAGDFVGAQEIVRRYLADGVPAHGIVSDLLLAAMSEIGARWERDELTIYQEHLATEIVVRLLAGLPAMIPTVPSIGRKALVSCAPEDHIQLAPMALTVYLELRGWQAVSLGQGLPADQIAAAVEALRPDAVFLSLAMVARLSGALETLERVSRLTPRPVVILGGRGAQLARGKLESAGAVVAESFDHAHRQALGGGGGHA